MKDTSAMRGVQGIRELHAQIQGLVDRQWAALQPFPERLALKKFHNDERLAVVFAQIVDDADIGMIQSGSRPRLSAKSGEMLRIPSKLRRQRLDRDLAAKVCVTSLPHLSHPAFADGDEDLVMADARSGFHCFSAYPSRTILAI